MLKDLSPAETLRFESCDHEIAMQSLLLFGADGQPFSVEPIHRVFRSEKRFRNIRFNEPGGGAIEADFVEDDDATIVGLSGNLKTISLSGTTNAALRAAMLFQRHVQPPLRITDLDYAFDLVLSEFNDIDELRAAMNNADGR